MRVIASLGEVHDVLAVQGVVSHDTIDCLAHPERVRIVKESCGCPCLRDSRQLPPRLPGVGPGAVLSGGSQWRRK